TFPWRSTGSTSPSPSRGPRMACSGSGAGRDALPVANRVLDAVVLLVARPAGGVEGAHVLADLVHDLVGEAGGAESLGQRFDREVASLERVHPHRLGNLRDVVERQLLVRPDHNVDRGRQEVVDLAG